jgi:hypothetical protein
LIKPLQKNLKEDRYLEELQLQSMGTIRAAARVPKFL